jgi:hypothetical protein
MKLSDLSKTQKEFLAWVKSDCEELGDCRLWCGRVTSSGYPLVRIDGKNTMLRREIAAMKIGRPLKRDEIAASTCNDPLCLAWDHVRVITQAQRRAETGAEGKYSTRAKGIRISMDIRKKAKLQGGQQAADSIRLDPRPSHVVCLEYGVSPSMVRKIRRGLAWNPISSPWGGLGART